MADIQQRLTPTQDEWNTIIAIGINVAIIVVLWWTPYLKEILLPFKIFTVALHEGSHAIGGLCTGARIKGISVEPDEGGVTHMQGGNPYVTLPAGYIGSCFLGSLMVFSAFNDLATKIVTCIVGVVLLLILWYSKTWLTRGICLLFIGMGALLWVFAIRYLRYFILFVGTMSALYALWDIVDDLIRRRVNGSDASEYSKICCGGCLPPQFWGVLWLLISIIFLCGTILIAIIVF